MSISPVQAYILDQVADVYTPLLLLLALYDLALKWRAGNKWHGLKLIYAIMVVYGWMFMDNHFQFWSRLGLDYSTHSAAAFALVVVIGYGKLRITQYALAMSLLAYGGLMYLLSYHSWGDMASTILILAGFLFPLFMMSRRQAAVTIP